ncbi:uncharacterized protein BX664DRAFT_328796 [Halteromyces radiatus]|uniref:uncharacterized protein n=1 Tax=Halteromyces radiatus TaxID=101107 RepID=UPI00221F498E|nr:uncharacterized protein BX664DRAFT_328796 [Halteromyces radiatus]KAI8093046.1 hypothetical protein BX664DRAFT_328796 [Halteromyces radiatus]
MIAQDRHTPSSYPTKESFHPDGLNNNRPVSHFLKEAVQILIQASRTVSINDRDVRKTVSTPSLSNHTEFDADTHSLLYTSPPTTTRQQTDENDQVWNENATVTWKLNLSATMITLDTKVQTIAGLEQVLEQLFANLEPHPSLEKPFSSSLLPSSTVSSEHYQMTGLTHAIGETLRLSQVLVVPQIDIFQQFNTIQLIKQCVQWFIMCDGALFMEVSDLLARTDRVLSSPTPFNNDEHSLDVLLLLSISCMMIRHVMIHRRGNTAVSAGLAHAYYSQARTRLQDFFDVPHITVLQSMFILSLFPHGHIDLFSTSRLCSTFLTSATRMALAMKLNQLDKKNNNNDTTKEYRRRLAWMILCADHFSSVNRTGQAGWIDVNDWHVDFPQPLVDENPTTTRRVQVLSHYCRTVMIRKMQLFRSAYMVVSQSNKALASSMDQNLFETYTSTPDYLRLPLNLLETDDHLKRQWTRDDVAPLLLEALHCNTLIMALVPFLPRRYLATFEQGHLTREAEIKNVYHFIQQQAALSNFSVTPLPPSTPLQPQDHQQTLNNMNDEDTMKNLEMHTVVGCLTAANRWTYILEILSMVDPLQCDHRPTHATVVLTYVYDLLQTHCQNSNVAMICRLNLIRTLRVVQVTRRTDPDLTLIYLDRILNSYITSSTDESSVDLERTTATLLSMLRTAWYQRNNSSSSSSLDGKIKTEPL